MSRAGRDQGALCQRIAELLAESNQRVVFAESCTAGLVSATLAAIPGISQYLCGSAVTYREDTKTRWLGVPVDVLREYSAVSLPVAERMAVGVLRDTPEADLSLSVTGHLGPHAPGHQDGLVYVGTATRLGRTEAIIPGGVYKYRLASTERLDRQCEAAERVLSRLEQMLPRPCVSNGHDLPLELVVELSGPDEAVVRVGGSWSHHRISDPARPRPAVLFPGAFNPLHLGHQEIAGIAEDVLGARPQFEIAIDNVDKAPLTPREIQLRISQFSPERTVWLTRSPTFLRKARLFPETTFLVGIDTIARIADPSYYGSDSEQRDRSIREIAELGCRFLVYGRLLGCRFAALDDLELPGGLGELCRGFSADRFRQDIASSDLRRNAGDRV